MEAVVTLVRELADSIQILADVVHNTRELADAVKDGREFFAREHADAKKDLVTLLSQMQKTIEGLASVTSVVTGFKFTETGAGVDYEPARFNEHMLAHKKKVAGLRGNIRELKGNCKKIRIARDKLNELAGNKSDWAAMFRLFSKQRRQMNARLAQTLSNFYADDQQVIWVVERLLDLSQAALTEADEALGRAGTASPHNVGAAAAVLNVYAAAFKQSEADLEALVTTLNESVDALR